MDLRMDWETYLANAVNLYVEKMVEHEENIRTHPPEMNEIVKMDYMTPCWSEIKKVFFECPCIDIPYRQQVFEKILDTHKETFEKYDPGLLYCKLFQERLNTTPYIQMFREYVLAVGYPYDDLEDLMSRYTELPKCLRTGFPYWFILKKIKNQFNGPTIRSEEKVQAMHDMWDSMLIDQIVKHM